MNDIFICYRREDSADVVGRIHERLVERFGKNSVFKDVDKIPYGRNFVDTIQRAVQQSDVVLAVIGKDWLETRDEAGERRLDNTDDYIRMEIVTALDNRTPVIPTLVHGVTMPSESELPGDLQPLAKRNAAHVRADPDFDADLTRLCMQLADLVKADSLDEHIRRINWAWIAAGVVAIAALAIVVMVTVLSRFSGQARPNSPTPNQSNGVSTDQVEPSRPDQRSISFAGRRWIKQGDGGARLLKDNVTEREWLEVYTHRGEVLIWSEQPWDLDDEAFTARCRVISGSTDLAFGPVFWFRDPENYYHFAVQTGGRYRLVRCRDGKFDLLIPWTSSQLVKGVYEHEQLAVRTQQHRIELLIDGQRVETYEADQAQPGRVGFYVQHPGLTVEFSEASLLDQ